MAEKEKKRGKCINEYREEGSCRKGKDRCRFSHDISPAERADPETQLKMKLRYENMLNPAKKNKSVIPTEGGGLTMDSIQKMFNQFLTQLNEGATIRKGP